MHLASYLISYHEFISIESIISHHLSHLFPFFCPAKAFQANDASGSHRGSSSGHGSSSGLGSAEEEGSAARRSSAKLGQFDVIMPSPGEMATVERKRTGKNELLHFE